MEQRGGRTRIFGSNGVGRVAVRLRVHVARSVLSLIAAFGLTLLVGVSPAFADTEHEVSQSSTMSASGFGAICTVSFPPDTSTASGFTISVLCNSYPDLIDTTAVFEIDADVTSDVTHATGCGAAPTVQLASFVGADWTDHGGGFFSASKTVIDTSPDVYVCVPNSAQRGLTLDNLFLTTYTATEVLQLVEYVGSNSDSYDVPSCANTVFVGSGACPSLVSSWWTAPPAGPDTASVTIISVLATVTVFMAGFVLTSTALR